MSHILEQINKLIALASSPYEEEARSAAFRACALIRANDVKLVLQLPPPPPRKPAAPPLSYGIARRYNSKYDGNCVACGEPYAVGDFIYWAKGQGATHTDCTDYWDQFAEVGS